MAEVINDKKVFSLLDVTKSIQRILNDRFSKAYWIKAEMNKLNYYKHSGHCYPDLVEKENGKTIAQIRATLWKRDFISINNKFLDVLKEPLKDGIKILILAKIDFTPVHGISLNIMDIDPAFTLGDLEQEKLETIQKLKAENIFDANKKLPLTILPQRIAIISVETSKGLADFLDVIEKNPFGYKYFYHLFPSLLQGEKAVHEIIKQLEKIEKVMHHFDAVAIIRGGGGDIGLSCYNHFELVEKIATFPLPIFTGIGHSTNETVAEMVSHTNAITPTKLAEFFIQSFHNFAIPLQKSQETIIRLAKNMLRESKIAFGNKVKDFKSATNNALLQSANSIARLTSTLQQETKHQLNHHHIHCKQMANQLKQTSGYSLKNEQNILQAMPKIISKNTQDLIEKNKLAVRNFEKNITLVHPKNVLKRGYSITTINGKIVKNIAAVKEGDTMMTQIYDATIESTVNKKTNKQ